MDDQSKGPIPPALSPEEWEKRLALNLAITEAVEMYGRQFIEGQAHIDRLEADRIASLLPPSDEKPPNG